MEGVLGPRPTAYLAGDAELVVGRHLVIGAERVAEALRELTAGAEQIRLEEAGDEVVATWPLAARSGRPWIVCRIAVAGDLVRSIRAEATDR